LQAECGYLPADRLKALSAELDIPLSRVYGVATFYTQFRFEPMGRHVVRVCHGTACHVNGAMQMADSLTEELGTKEGETSGDGEFSVERVACLGCCSLSPVIMVDDTVFGKLDKGKVKEISGRLKRGELDGR
jgi:NADH-quinone oxidoreductase subunit E